MTEGANEVPNIAKNLGLKIITLNVFGPDHQLLAVVEAERIDPVRDFAFQSRLAQWNTVNIHATWSLEEAMAKVKDLPTIF